LIVSYEKNASFSKTIHGKKKKISIFGGIEKKFLAKNLVNFFSRILAQKLALSISK